MSDDRLFGENFSRKKRVAFAFTAMIVFSALYLFPPHLYSGIIYSEDEWVQRIAFLATSFSYKVFVFVLCALFVKKVLKRNLGITVKGFFKGLFIFGSLMLVYSALNFLFSFPFNLQGDGVDYDTAYKLLPVYFVHCLGIGIGEEGVWRVLGVNLFSWAFGEGKKNGFFALFIPSVIFGLAHLNNLITPPVLVNSTIAQVIYATMIGFYFAVCYYKTGNLIPSMLLHALFDFAYYACRGFYPKEELIKVVKTDISPLGLLINVALHIPLFLFALMLFFNFFTTQKKETEPPTEETDKNDQQKNALI